MKKPLKQRHSFDYDLIVIGSGAGGSVAATIAARSGKRVAIIEADAFGGDSSNWSDIPLAAILKTAHIYQEAKTSADLGIRATTLGHNYPTIRTWKETAIKKSGIGNDRSFYTKQGIATFHGKAHFLTPHEITVNRRHLSSRYFIVATGSEWVTPNIQGLQDVDYYTPKTILSALRPPKRLAIIGSSRSAIEIAQFMATFNTHVTIIEQGAHILSEFDVSASEELSRVLQKNHSISVLTGTKTLSIAKHAREKRITLSHGGTQKHITVDDILIAGPTTPNTDIGLENATVIYSKKGIPTNQYLQTNVKHIYATGDVLGKSLDTTATLLESRVAAHNLLTETKARPDYTAMPKVIVTHPGIAQVGYTEQEARRAKIAATWATVPLSSVAASTVGNFHDGLVKIGVNAKGVIIGGVIVAPQAHEIIQEVTLAVRHRLTARQLAHTPHTFLTWSEAIRIAAQKLSKSDIV